MSLLPARMMHCTRALIYLRACMQGRIIALVQQLKGDQEHALQCFYTSAGARASVMACPHFSISDPCADA